MRKTWILLWILMMYLGTTEALAVSRVTLTPTVTTPAPMVVVVSNKTVEPKERWNGINTIRMGTRLAIERGVSENTVVLLLLLPLLATLVSVLHYLLGFSGYGIFMPSMMAVAFLATGIVGGLLWFAMILIMSLLSNMVLRRYRLHFWPSRAINLVFITLGTLGLMLGLSFVPVLEMNKISIFPILFMILLTEEFARTQLAKSRSEAKKLTLGTLVLAGIGAGVMSIGGVRETALQYPELCLGLGLLINFMVGNYTGIRLSEIKRFGKAIRKK